VLSQQSLVGLVELGLGFNDQKKLSVVSGTTR
jgi:hypothetical protein